MSDKSIDRDDQGVDEDVDIGEDANADSDIGADTSDDVFSAGDGRDGPPDVPTEWVDKGIKDVALADLPQPEGVSNESDYQKVSKAEMRAGLERLQEMRPTIEGGDGASSDYWAQIDQQQELDYANGHQKIYDAFYGQDSIRLNKDGDDYNIINGRHRIALGKEMGIDTLPARVIEREQR
ncbi:MAG: hypothetical protein M3R24_05780 [Chloroflexota bacterium]|nr:hypothetical protein [Chloroflexota bacterium]